MCGPRRIHAALNELAERSQHLTPRLSAAEVAKISPGVDVIAVHIKPAFARQVTGELATLGSCNLSVGVGGREYVLESVCNRR